MKKGINFLVIPKGKKTNNPHQKNKTKQNQKKPNNKTKIKQKTKNKKTPRKDKKKKKKTKNPQHTKKFLKVFGGKVIKYVIISSIEVVVGHCSN